MQRRLDLDEEEDIAAEVPAQSDRGPADPTDDGKGAPDADLPADPATDAIAPETGSEVIDVGAGDNPAARLYKLRPAGLRPVRRGLRRHGLHNDCPPDQRRWPGSSSPRTRLR